MNNLGLPKPVVTIAQMKKLFDLMINATPENNERSRKLEVSKILYYEEELGMQKAPVTDDPHTLFKAICRKRQIQQTLENFDLYFAIYEIIAPVDKNIPRLRLLMIAFFSHNKFDTATTAAYVIGQMESCVYQKTDKLSIDRSKLAQATFNDLDKLQTNQNVIIAAYRIKHLPKTLIKASLIAFLAAHDEEYIRLQQVCLALFPTDNAVLTNLFNNETIAKNLDAWKKCFQTLATDAGHGIDLHACQIFQNKNDPRLILFLEIYLPVFSLSLWGGAVSLSMALINLNEKLSILQMSQSCETVLKLLAKHHILMFKGADITAFATEISEKHYKISSAVVLPKIPSGSNSGEMV